MHGSRVERRRPRRLARRRLAAVPGAQARDACEPAGGTPAFHANRERLDIVHAAETLRAPLLVVHGARDESVPLESGKLLAQRADDASLLVISSATHTFNAIHPLVHVPFELVLAAEASAHFAIAHS
jgi:pimeloyl-ACP methyl ester carboxylesterase